MMIPFSKAASGCPCYECGKRHMGCHGKCDSYKGWRKELDKRNEEERTTRISSDTMSEHAKRELWRKQRYPYNTKHYRERDDR